MTDEILKSLTPEEAALLQIEKMTDKQRYTLAEWGLRMFGLGRHTVSYIDKIKYEGRLIILDDGSRWEVDPTDACISEMWVQMDKVVVVDGEMYRLDESEMVNVEEEETQE